MEELDGISDKDGAGGFAEYAVSAVVMESWADVEALKRAEVPGAP